MVVARLATDGRIDVRHTNVGIVAVGGPVVAAEADRNRVLAVDPTSQFPTGARAGRSTERRQAVSDWWYVIAILGLAAVGVRYLLSRRNRTSRSSDDHRASAPTQRDYAKERADARLARMSEEDRAWEAASLQRDRATRERFGQAGGEPGFQLERTYPSGASSSTDLVTGRGLSRE
jgi:hypothetical protein